ncbi:MAG: F0F1 ATP synthase subunit alpha, partial [Nevskia sp.]|nr:F0F1 ATP synthase subunit alpha [Nevskia sp.]
MTTELRPDEITSILKKRIEEFQPELTTSSVGTVISVGDGICHIYGLDKAMAGELLDFGQETSGMVFQIEQDSIGAIIFGSGINIKEGDQVRTTARIASVPVGSELLGRVVDAIGRPIDGKGPINTKEFRPLEVRAPGIVERQPVKEPLQTGIAAIDAMIPIGRGQRELIIGDRQTGKTTIAVDAIINQKGKNCICVYVAIGQKASSVARVIKTLEDFGAMEYTIVVAATAEDSAPMNYLAPY